jgi:hypothetical protein
MSRAKRRRRQVRELLEKMYLWQCLGTDNATTSVALSEPQLKNMYAGQAAAPWATPASDGVASQLHFGRLLYLAMADWSRAVEELHILEVEHARLLNWLMIMGAAIRKTSCVRGVWVPLSCSTSAWRL